MSWVICHSCDEMINTDDDPACFLEDALFVPEVSRKVGLEIMCERCREAYCEDE